MRSNSEAKSETLEDNEKRSKLHVSDAKSWINIQKMQYNEQCDCISQKMQKEAISYTD